MTQNELPSPIPFSSRQEQSPAIPVLRDTILIWWHRLSVPRWSLKQRLWNKLAENIAGKTNIYFSRRFVTAKYNYSLEVRSKVSAC